MLQGREVMTPATDRVRIEARVLAAEGKVMTNQEQRCSRCHSVYSGQPYLMAGREFCCQSCSVGSACEHQGIHRSTSVRRYDTMFDRFRQVVRENSPYEVQRNPVHL
ncbi:MAG TPA: hypothetical protein PKI89_11990 [Tepidiformaceae bacterium]|nr:hypothetical protein [Tepidiformaceae bacterium]HNO66839.1 hypothetical protein [Tepidiformaceae bacterium]